jgi:hypothetical protein
MGSDCTGRSVESWPEASRRSSSRGAEIIDYDIWLNNRVPIANLRRISTQPIEAKYVTNRH